MLRNIVRTCAVWAVFALGMMPGQVCLAAAPGAGYWHTSGNKILDSNNQPVRIAGINWYGFETTDEVVHGLGTQDYKTILNTIQANGYNTVRLPYSNQVVEAPVVPTAVAFYNSNNQQINVDLQGLNSLQIMDAIVSYAGSIGLRIILDNHRSEAGNSAEASGLWYTGAYPESSWISDWQALVTRYQSNTTVIGVDLRNEPHNAASGGACWDCGTATNDWHLAAERAGNAVLAINPSLLIFVEGTDEYNNNYYFWGGNLQGVQTSPVILNTANQLVYEAHDYGPHESAQAWFNSNTTYDSLVSTWTSYWAYISLNGIAPVWVGEFGTLNDDADVESSTSGSQGQWFSSLVQFLGANGSINWTYWALNGEDSYALLDSNYDSTPASALKQQLLSGIQFPLSGGTPITTPSFTLSQSPSTVVAATSNTDTGSSGNTTEAVYDAIVNNRTSSALPGATITLTLPAAAVVITQTTTGSTGTCTNSGPAYTCTFGALATAGFGGIRLTVIYPAANLTFNGSGQSSQSVSATASAGSQTLPSTSVTTVVDQQSQQPGTSVSVVATVSPGYSYNYGQAANVNFSLTPTPTSPIPLSQFSAQLDGTQALTVTSLGSNSYQIPLSTLSGGSHSVVIHLAASTSYAASSATVSLAVQKATASVTVNGASTATYGTGVAFTLGLSGLSGVGFAAPTGTVSMVVDGQAPQTATFAGGTASLTVPANLTATTHAVNFSYSGDSNYAAQNTAASLVIKPAPLTATAAAGSRAFGAANPTFTGTLTGVLNGDPITATYVSQATATTPAGTYSTGTYAITPVLADPSNRLANYTATLNDGALTITNGSSTGSDITWATPAAIMYGTPLSATQLDATASVPGTFVYIPPAGSVLTAGSQSLSVTFYPTGSASSETAKTTLQVNLATTTTTLSALTAPNGGIALTAVTAATTGGQLTGAIKFLDGTTQITNIGIDGKGQATYTAYLSAGAHTLTATYTGDANSLGSTSASVTITVSGTGSGGGSTTGFTLNSNPTYLTLGAGKTGSATLSVVTTGTFSGTLSFTCTGLPSGSTCSFDPATLSTSTNNSTNSNVMTTTLTIGLPGGSARVRPQVSERSGTYFAGIFMLPGGLLGLYLLWQRKRLHRSVGIWILTAAFLLSVSIGCGTSGSSGGSVGSYNAVITATAPTGVQTLTIPVTLTN